MEPMDTLTKPGIMAKLRNRRGFSLIEMAIVLVIIGIIIGAIIKGQDLMLNSRAKQLVSAANAWKIAAFSFMDRNGRLPGDTAKSGIINSVAGVGSTAINDITTTMPQAPENPILIGGQSFWFYFGNITVTTGGQPDARNCMVVCRSVDCGTKLSVEDVEMFKALDTAIEGSTDAKAGQVRAISTAGTSTFHTVAATATTVSRANGSVGLDLATDVEATSSTWSTSHYGAVWTFDKPY